MENIENIFYDLLNSSNDYKEKSDLLVSYIVGNEIFKNEENLNEVVALCLENIEALDKALKVNNKFYDILINKCGCIENLGGNKCNCLQDAIYSYFKTKEEVHTQINKSRNLFSKLTNDSFKDDLKSYVVAKRK